jgi:hypothetical protein
MMALTVELRPPFIAIASFISAMDHKIPAQW